MTRTNLVDAYDNRSVVAKLVSMEERISGAETSVEASAEAAASSASAAAASQTAAKTSETNAKASADAAAATLSNTVDLTSKQTVTGAKTFAGDTAVTGSFVTSGNAEMSKLDIDTGKLTVGSGGSAEIHGPLTADNTSNTLKVADHASVLTGNDVLSAKDIMTANGDANNLMHRTGEIEPIYKEMQLKGYPGQINLVGMSADSASPSGDVICGRLNCCDKNGVVIFELIGVVGSKGEGYVNISVRNSDGTMKVQRLITGD